MRYYSTRNPNLSVSFSQAALAGLAEDGGLFVPETIPELTPTVRSSLASMDFHAVAYETIRPYVHPEIPDSVLADLIQSAYPFGAPVVSVNGRGVLELFHGPTAAFKDFGARFMARAFSYLRRGEDRPLRILVATSGDTGGAVADGFFNVPGISVTVLYPQGRVSPLQERQIAGLGGNISALAVEGSFDDCQRLVKAALGDRDLNSRFDLSSANSINVARLVPQTTYYVAASGRIASGVYDADEEATPRLASPQGAIRFPRSHAPSDKGAPVVFSVPSGNFGNLTAGLYARAMGAPIARFIAATNVNRTVPDYLEKGNYEPRASIPTISNAMDVGAPSNFERMKTHWSWKQLREMLVGVSVTDDETRSTIQRVATRGSYVLDPHGAVAWTAVDAVAQGEGGGGEAFVVLATAHPAKFAETVDVLVGPVAVPPALRAVMERDVNSLSISAEFTALKGVLLSNSDVSGS
jgi:threonine synthase